MRVSFGRKVPAERLTGLAQVSPMRLIGPSAVVIVKSPLVVPCATAESMMINTSVARVLVLLNVARSTAPTPVVSPAVPMHWRALQSGAELANEIREVPRDGQGLGDLVDDLVGREALVETVLPSLRVER